jgi:galactose mutarotase-like enzyme
MTGEAILLQRGVTSVEVLPSLGALVSRLFVGGVSILYLDEATLDSPSGAVRGGIPLLFPFAGELADGRLSATGTEMPRHGFGRRKAWKVTERSGDAVVMRLEPDADTHAQFPFIWDASQCVSALPRGLHIELRVRNNGTAPMPLAPGWHPYFPCPTPAKRACLGPLVAAGALAGNPVACDVNVPASPDRRVAFDVPSIGPLQISFSDNVRTLEIWTPPDRELVCVEPWVGPSNTINTPDAVTVASGETVTFWMRVEKAGA